MLLADKSAVIGRSGRLILVRRRLARAVLTGPGRQRARRHVLVARSHRAAERLIVGNGATLALVGQRRIVGVFHGAAYTRIRGSAARRGTARAACS